MSINNPQKPAPQTPLTVVNQRMAAHNQHDLAAFLAVYAADIQIYDYPDIPLGRKGKAHLQSIFEPLFNDKAVQVHIHYQVENGCHVINHETVTRRGERFEYVSIYEVQDGLIVNVRFIKNY